MTVETFIIFFGKFYRVIVYYFFKKIGKIRQQGNRPVVYKKARVLCFVNENNFSDFKFALENTCSCTIAINLAICNKKIEKQWGQ